MKKIAILCTILFLHACQPTLVAEFEDIAVVEGYLYAGNSPVVKVSKLIALRDDVDFSQEDIEHLDITVTDDDAGQSYYLTSLGGGEYSAPGLTVQQGHTDSLMLVYNGKLVEATTLIPPKPQNMALSATTLSVPKRPSKATGNEPVEVTWDNPDGDYYMIVVECTETNPTSIFDWDEDDEEQRPRFAFRTEPSQASSGQLSMQNFSYYGSHNVILVRMQPEYVLLYQSTGNTIAEIHANVENGYGIFTGLNADTVKITVNATSGF